MSNVLSDDKRQQIIALGRLGWSLRRIQQATGVRRETASAYLKTAGINVRRPGNWGRAAKPAIEVTTDCNPTTPPNPAANKAESAKPAIQVSALTKKCRNMNSCRLDRQEEFKRERLMGGW
jgi:CxxC motif-containing protein (DUF1111 family)